VSAETIPYRRRIAERVKSALIDYSRGERLDSVAHRISIIAEEEMQPEQFVIIDGKFYPKQGIKTALAPVMSYGMHARRTSTGNGKVIYKVGECMPNTEYVITRIYQFRDYAEIEFCTPDGKLGKSKIEVETTW
jgi:hypothetical protein